MTKTAIFRYVEEDVCGQTKTTGDEKLILRVGWKEIKF